MLALCRERRLGHRHQSRDACKKNDRKLFHVRLFHWLRHTRRPPEAILPDCWRMSFLYLDAAEIVRTTNCGIADQKMLKRAVRKRTPAHPSLQKSGTSLEKKSPGIAAGAFRFEPIGSIDVRISVRTVRIRQVLTRRVPVRMAGVVHRTPVTLHTGGRSTIGGLAGSRSP